MGKDKYYTAWNRPQKRYYSKTGDGTKKTYNINIDENGHKYLSITGKENVYERIQKNTEGTSIREIMKRASIGDMSGFIKEGEYADLTNAPTSLAEAQMQINNLKNIYGSLSNEIKEKFNMSPEQFVAEAGKEGFLEKLGLIEKDTATETEPKETELKEEK